MPKLLKEIGFAAERPLRPEDGRVENMSRVVCALLIQGLQKKVKTADFWKISIGINNRDRSEDQKVILGVLVVNRDFPVTEFLGWTLKKRQDYMLNFVSDTIREIFLERGLDASLVDDAIEYVTQKKFLNIIVGKKKFRNPSLAEVAHIECEQEMDEARIYISLKANKGQQRRVLLTKTVPEEFIFQIFFGSIEWLDSQYPVLRRADGVLISINGLQLH